MNHRITIPFALSLFCIAAPARAAQVDVLASAALGDELGGRPAALDLFDDGSVVVGGADEHGGTIVRLDESGAAVASTRVDAPVHDVAIDRRTGQIAIVGPTELVVLAGDLGIVWRTSLPALPGEADRRLAVGELGTIAVAAAGQLRTFSPEGTQIGVASVSDGTTSGVAVLDHADLVVTTGWSSRCDVEIVSLAGFARDGSPRWNAYDDTRCDLARTRGIDVARGEDGLVYLLAEVEGGANVFDRHGSSNVAFDPLTSIDDVTAQRFAYYARVSPSGEHVLGQYFSFPDEEAVVRPRMIAADAHGNVVLTGSTTHALENEDDVGHGEALHAPAGFYQLVRADFRERRLWRSLELDDTSTEGVALALAGPRVVALLHTARLPDADVEPSPAGPMVLTFPTDPQHAIPKRPDRDDVGTFGYESGVAGSDPTCHACGPTRAPRPIGVLALAALVLVGRRRRG